MSDPSTLLGLQLDWHMWLSFPFPRVGVILGGAGLCQGCLHPVRLWHDFGWTLLKGLLEGAGVQRSVGRGEGGEACGIKKVYLDLLWEGTWGQSLAGRGVSTGEQWGGAWCLEVKRRMLAAALVPAGNYVSSGGWFLQGAVCLLGGGRGKSHLLSQLFLDKSPEEPYSSSKHSVIRR